MSVLILNGWPLTRAPYHEWLKDIARPVILFTAQGTLDVPEQQLAYYGAIETFEHFRTSGAVERRALQLYDRFSFDTVVALDERDILRGAALRDQLGIKGQNIQSAVAFRDKYWMKTLASQAGIKTNAFAALRSPIDLVRFVDIHGFPVVLKPRFGSGSEGVIVLRNEDHLDEALNGRSGYTDSWNSVYIMERFNSLDLYHIDGLVADGRVLLCWPSRFLQTHLEFGTQRRLTSYTLGPQNMLVRTLQQFAGDVLNALPHLHNSAFHVEVFVAPDGDLYLGEIGSRAGGNVIPRQLELAFGVHLNAQSTRAQCQLPVTSASQAKWPRQLAARLLIAGDPNQLDVARFSRCDWIHDAVVMPSTQRTGRVDVYTDPAAMMLITADSEAEIQSRIDVAFASLQPSDTVHEDSTGRFH